MAEPWGSAVGVLGGRRYEELEQCRRLSPVPRHDKRPDSNPIAMNRNYYESCGEYEKRSGPRSAIRRKYNKRANEVYIRNKRPPQPIFQPPHFFRGATGVTSHRCRIPARRRPFYEKAAPIADEPTVKASHQPKTTAMHVPRLTLVRQENAMPASISVQMVKMSTDTRRV
jgi:hypothetical protein